MPTLSPQPPPSNTSVGEPATPNTFDSGDVKPNIADLITPKSEPSLNQVNFYLLVVYKVKNLYYNNNEILNLLKIKFFLISL